MAKFRVITPPTALSILHAGTITMRQYVQKISLASILVSPEVGMPADVLFDPDLAIKATQKLMCIRRRRLLLLRKLGWKRLDGDAFAFAESCPPSFAKTKQCARPCRLVSFCPFCWARRVAEVYAEAEQMLFGSNQLRRIDPDTRDIKPAEPIKVDAIEISVACKTPSDVALRPVIKAQTPELKTWFRRFGSYAVGGVSRIAMAPSDLISYEIHKRWLVFTSVNMPSRYRPAPADNCHAKITRYPISHRELAAAVGRTLQYPSAMLFGDAGLTMNLLEAMHSTKGKSPHMQATYGTLRKAANRYSDDHFSTSEEG